MGARLTPVRGSENEVRGDEEKQLYGTACHRVEMGLKRGSQ